MIDASATPGDGVDDVLDLLAVHVLAAGDDHVLLAVDDRRVALLVGAAEVAGVEPAAGERLLVGLRAAPVAEHHLVALDDDLADLADGHVAHVVVDEAEPAERHRAAGGGEQLGALGARPSRCEAGSKYRTLPRQLGHPEALHEVGAGEPGHRPAQRLDRHRRAAVGDRPQRRQREVVDLRVLQQHRQHRRGERRRRHAVAVDHRHRVERLVGAPQDERDAHQHAR